MTEDARMTWGFIIDVLNIFEPHSYRRSDDQHTGQAIGLIGDVVAHIHEGTLEAPRGAYVVVPSSRPPTSEPAGSAGQGAVIVSADEVKTVLAALDEAAGHKRDLAAACAAATQPPGPDRAEPARSHRQAATEREAGQ